MRSVKIDGYKIYLTQRSKLCIVGYMKLTLQKGIDPLLQEVIWLMLDEEYQIVEPIQRYLTYLCGSKSPNTVESYGYDLKAWWQFIDHKCLDWRNVRLSDARRFRLLVKGWRYFCSIYAACGSEKIRAEY